MADKQTDQFDLAKLPAHPVGQAQSGISPEVKKQLDQMKLTDARLGPAMESVEKDSTLDTTFLEGQNFKFKAVGKVAGVNFKGKF